MRSEERTAENPGVERTPGDEHSAEYRIIVSGHLSERLRHAFPEMSSHPIDGCTELSGRLADAGALYGVLDRCRDLHLDVVSFERVA